MSVPTLASTSFVSTVQVRYVWLSFRLYLVFNSWISIEPSIQKLCREKANMLMNISLPRPPVALMQRHFASFFRRQGLLWFFQSLTVGYKLPGQRATSLSAVRLRVSVVCFAVFHILSVTCMYMYVYMEQRVIGSRPT